MENEIIKKRNLEIRKNRIQPTDFNIISSWLFNEIDTAWIKVRQIDKHK